MFTAHWHFHTKHTWEHNTRIFPMGLLIFQNDFSRGTEKRFKCPLPEKYRAPTQTRHFFIFDHTMNFIYFRNQSTNFTILGIVISKRIVFKMPSIKYLTLKNCWRKPWKNSMKIKMSNRERELNIFTWREKHWMWHPVMTPKRRKPYPGQ